MKHRRRDDRPGTGRVPRTFVPGAVALLLAAVSCSPGWAWRHDQVGKAPPPCAALVTPGTRAGLVAALDGPHRDYPADRVALWRMVEQDGACIASSRSRAPLARHEYTLVVQFDAADRVARWSLVEALWD